MDTTNDTKVNIQSILDFLSNLSQVDAYTSQAKTIYSQIFYALKTQNQEDKQVAIKNFIAFLKTLKLAKKAFEKDIVTQAEIFLKKLTKQTIKKSTEIKKKKLWLGLREKTVKTTHEEQVETINFEKLVWQLQEKDKIQIALLEVQYANDENLLTILKESGVKDVYILLDKKIEDTNAFNEYAVNSRDVGLTVHGYVCRDDTGLLEYYHFNPRDSIFVATNHLNTWAKATVLAFVNENSRYKELSRMQMSMQHFFTTYVLPKTLIQENIFELSILLKDNTKKPADGWHEQHEVFYLGESQKKGTEENRTKRRNRENFRIVNIINNTVNQFSKQTNEFIDDIYLGLGLFSQAPQPKQKAQQSLLDLTIKILERAKRRSEVDSKKMFSMNFQGWNKLKARALIKLIKFLQNKFAKGENSSELSETISKIINNEVYEIGGDNISATLNHKRGLFGSPRVISELTSVYNTFGTEDAQKHLLPSPM